MGPEEAIIGAFIDGANSNPRKKKVIFIVMPKIERRNKFSQSFFSIHSDFTAKGKSKYEAAKKRKKARVKGVIFCSASLKIGEAAPQMMLATINARTACL